MIYFGIILTCLNILSLIANGRIIFYILQLILFSISTNVLQMLIVIINIYISMNRNISYRFKELDNLEHHLISVIFGTILTTVFIGLYYSGYTEFGI